MRSLLSCIILIIRRKLCWNKRRILHELEDEVQELGVVPINVIASPELIMKGCDILSKHVILYHDWQVKALLKGVRKLLKPLIHTSDELLKL
jgi:hypothetical protein